MTTRPTPRIDNQWYYAAGKKKVGPFSFGELRHLVRINQLQPSSMILQEGTKKWLTAGSVPGLFADSIADDSKQHETIDVAISFPNTRYKHETTLQVRN